MAKYVFDLVGCTDTNLAAVKAAIATIPGVTFSITKSARGAFVLFIECSYIEEEILNLLNGVLAPLGVRAQKQPPESKPQVGGPKF